MKRIIALPGLLSVLLLFTTACDTKDPNEPQGGNLTPSYCSYNGFEAQTKLAFWDHPWYDFILMSGMSTNEPVTYLDMQFYKDSGSKPQLGKVGKVNLDVDPNDCGTCLVISTNCVEGLCEELYYAGEGELNITAWDQKGGTFSGTLKDAVFFQIERDTNGYFKYTENGKMWCVSDYSFSTEVLSVYDLN